MREYEHPALAPGRLLAGPLAACWIILTLLWRLPDPYWWVTTLSFLPIIPVQRRANQINSAVAPDHNRNGRLNWLNWVGVVAFGVVVLLAVIGAFLPEEYTVSGTPG